MNRRNGSFWNIGCCLGAILLSPVFLVILVLHLLYTPIDFIIYMRSSYRKNTKQGYVWLVSTSQIFKLYTLIEREGLNIEYYQIPSTSSACGYLVTNGVVIDYDSLAFLGEDDRWYINVEDRDQRLGAVEDITLTEFEAAHGHRPQRVVYLIERGAFGEEETLSKAEKESSFFLYDKKAKGSLTETLKKIILLAEKEASLEAKALDTEADSEAMQDGKDTTD